MEMVAKEEEIYDDILLSDMQTGDEFNHIYRGNCGRSGNTHPRIGDPVSGKISLPQGQSKHRRLSRCHAVYLRSLTPSAIRMDGD